MRAGVMSAVYLFAAVVFSVGCGASNPVKGPPDHSLIIVSSGGGSILTEPPGVDCRSDCLFSSVVFPQGTAVQIIATPNPGGFFVGWGGDCAGQTGPVCTVKMDSERNVNINFTNNAFSLQVSKQGTGVGEVTSVPDGVQCGPACNARYPQGTTVTLTATPGEASTFMGWSGACEGTGPCTFVMDRDRAVVANFKRNAFPVNIVKAGDGAGKVTSTPAGLDCGATCSAEFDVGATVTIRAAAETGNTFAGWEGGGCAGTDSCTLTMTEARTVKATFVRTTFLLTVLRNSGGTVTSSPSGIDCGAGCAAPFAAGLRVTLTATPVTGAQFGGWSGTGITCGESTTCEVTMTQARTITARFTYQVSVSKVGTGPGRVTSAPTGIDCGAACSARFDVGSVVTLTAQPEASSSFTGWSGGCSGSEATCTLTLVASRSVTATFVKNLYSINIFRRGSGTGAVRSVPNGIDCDSSGTGTCSANFDGGAEVTLTASASGGSVFAGWAGECSGSGTTCVIRMNTNKSVEATFSKVTFPLTVVKTGTGTVTTNPFTIFCGPTCTAPFEIGTVVTLNASSDAGAAFTGWSGACTGPATTCTVTMDGAKTVNATFTSASHVLTITRAGAGDGAIASTPAGIACGTNCNATFAGGTVVTLSASPAAGSSFLGWQGACSGLGDCVVSMTGPRGVTATFGRTTFQLAVTKVGSGTGTVKSEPTGIDCGTACVASFEGGTSITLTATSSGASVFAGWDGACTGTGTCTVPMTEAQNVTAYFDKVTHTLSVNTGAGGGSVTSNPFGLFCGPICDTDFDAGASVRLTASPDATANFAGWTGACSGTSPTCTVAMDAPKSVTARFTFPLSVTKGGSGGGIVASSLGGINCGATCRAELDPDLVVTLTATPDSTSIFGGWQGACTGTEPCVVTMDLAKSVTATFTRNVVALNVARTGTGSGRITSSPAGIDCGNTCSAGYLFGSQVTLTAEAAAGSGFAGWSGACAGTGACTVTLDGAKSVSATFTRVLSRLTVSVGAGGGIVTSDPAAIYCGASCLNDFDGGTVVTLVATPDFGATFQGWEGACTGTGDCILTMNTAKTVTARFKFPLVVSRGGAGAGTITSVPAGIDCGGTCSANFDNGVNVRLTAAAAAGSFFAGWSGDCGGLADCTLPMESARNAVATFERRTNTLTVSLTGTGHGVVTSTPTGIDCGDTCSQAYDASTSVTLAAAPNADSTFAGWSGACTGTGGCTVTLEAARLVSATFTLKTFALSITRTGRGTVTSDVGGIFCGAACSASISAGSSVTLTATPDSGAQFAGWSNGVCSGTTTTCTVPMTQARAVTATFTTNAFALGVTLAGNGTGSVTSSPAGITCGTTCSANYDSGTLVILSATPSATASFGGWAGACTGTQSCTVTMSQARAVTATFTKNTYSVSVAKTGTGGGSVTSTTPAGIDCGGTCSFAFDAAAALTLRATADGNSTFAGWSGACTGTADCTFTVNAPTSVTATFTKRTFALTVNRTGPGTVTSAPSRIYCGAACVDAFDAGSTVVLTATPDANASFVSWGGGTCSGSSTTCSVLVDQARTVTANFTTSSHVLAVAKSGTGDGTVISTPAGISCGGACSIGFDAGTVVTLTASADANSLFSSWGGVCAGAGACTVTMSAARSVTANFSRNTFLLSVNRTGTGAGTVSANTGGLSCGSTCAVAYNAGSSVVLTAGASAGSSFAGWSGACAGTSATCTVTMDAAKNVTASFSGSSFSLAVSIGSGGGVVTSDPVGIYCGAQCASTYNQGAIVTLTAISDPTATFAGWSGACAASGTSPNCSVTIDGAKTVGARFTYRLTVTKTGAGAGTVTSSPSAIGCGTTCGADFDNLATVVLTASPDTASTFAGWSGACSGTGSCTVVVDASKTATANFARATYPLTVTRTGSGTGTVTSSPGSISCGATCAATYDTGTAVQLTAAADSTSTFTGWSGACGGTAAICNVTVDAAKSATATFTKRTVTLTVNRTGRGTVTSNVGGVFCGAACGGTFDAGSQVVLTASPDSGATFGGWTGGSCTGTGTCTLTLTADTTLSAPFTTSTNPLTITKAGAGVGTVSSSPGGITCGTTCTASFTSDQSVTLTATPDSVSVFGGWGGACSGTGLCVVPMSAARTVTATFTANTFVLSVSKLGAGGGTVTSDVGGISCGAVCSGNYASGAVVQLTAAADATSTFAGWSGACSGTAGCSVTMSASSSVSATFTRKQFALTVSRTGGGTVTSSPSGLYCGAACSASFDAGAQVILTASADPTAAFAGWGGACSGATATCTLTMNAAQNVTANFTVTLAISHLGSGAGTVTNTVPAGGALNCGSTCSAPFSGNTLVTLSATADATSTFAGWGGACTGSASTCTLTMNDSKNVTASWTRTTFALAVTKTGTGGGQITSSPAGIDCGATCAGNFVSGAQVTLTAAADTTSTFAGWTGSGCSGTTPCVVTMAAARSVTATFSRVTYALSVTRTSGGTVTADTGGIYCGAACSGSFTSGTVVTLTASADVGATFAGWTGACTGAAACVITMDAVKTVHARFTYPLAVSRTGAGSGTITSDTGGITCGATCNGTYNGGTTVQLTAAASSGSTFIGWAGACSGGATTCNVLIDGAKSVSAAFSTNTVTLAVARQGSGGGQITSSPTGIDCGALCQANFDQGATVQLTAVTDATSTFTGWGGACSGVTTTCSVSMTTTKQVTATFARRTFNVNVTRFGGGTVTSNPAGIYCGAQCAGSFPAGTQIILTGTPDSGSSFSGWSGATCSGSGTCTITVNADVNVTANFTFPLQVNKFGNGVVTSGPPGINCGSTCNAIYAPGTVVTLTATPGTGENFTGWSGSCGGTGACSVTMDGAKTVSAAFGNVVIPDHVEGVITNAPPNPSRSTTATFFFNSIPAYASFTCSVDGSTPTSCTSPVTYTNLSEGAHTFAVTATLNGDTDPTPATYAWTIDTVAPGTSITSSPPARTNVKAPTLTFTSTEAGSTFVCKVDAGNFFSCASPYTISPQLADGTHTFYVVATDRAGNTDPFPASVSWITDTVAPNTTINANPTNPSNVTNPQFQFSADEPSTFLCSLDGATPTTCTSPRTVSVTAQGAHSFSVTAVDTAGSPDPTPAVYNWTLDTVQPNTTIDAASKPPSLTNSTTANFTFTSTETGGTFRCSLNGATPTTCSSPQGYGGLTNGTQTFSVFAVDAAGNADPSPDTYSWLVDITAPVATINSNPLARTNLTTPSFTFSSNEANSTFRCRFDGAAFTACTSPLTGTPLAEGSHTFQVIAKDPAQNEQSTGAPTSYTWVVDTTPPDTSFGSTPPNPSNLTTPTFTFTPIGLAGGESVTYRCSLDGAAAVSCSTPYSPTVSANTSHTLTVAAVDQAGNQDPSPTSYTWTVDTILPTTTLGTPVPALVTNLTTASFTFTSNETGTFRCQLDSNSVTTCVSGQSYSGLSNGAHTFRVFAVDNANNADATAEIYTWTVDTVPPSVPAAPTATGGDKSVTLTWTAVNDATPAGIAGYKVYRDSVLIGTVVGSTNTTFVDTAAALVNYDAYAYQLTSYDNVGNESSLSATTFGVPYTPITLPTPGPVGAGIGYSCVIKGDATKTWCWGSVGNYQAGNNNASTQYFPFTPVLDVGGTANSTFTGAASIATGGSHTCAVKGGGVYCWGLNGNAQIGNQSTTTAQFPYQAVGPNGVGLMANITQVAVGGTHTCALRNDGAVFCWGNNGNRQIGANTINPNEGDPLQVVDVATTGFLSNIRSIAAGSAHTCAASTTGAVYCWGLNSSGQLGDNTGTQRQAPVQVVGPNGVGFLSNVLSVSAHAGGTHTCAARADGTVFCWGNGGNGQLGDNTNGTRLAPVQVKGIGGTSVLTRVAQLTVGSVHTCARRLDSGVYCWGLGNTGQLGDNTTNSRPAPIVTLNSAGTGPLTTVTSIGAGNQHTCATLSDNTVQCWGQNNTGQVGSNRLLNKLLPTRVMQLGPLAGGRSLSLGATFSTLNKDDNTLVSWGQNNNGQLGDGTSTMLPMAVPVVGVASVGNLGGITQVSSGDLHQCALQGADGSLYCWGNNGNGQLGDNTKSSKTTPIQVVNASNSGPFQAATQISSGGTHTCALVGSLQNAWCWGSNTYGQLGDGTVLERIIPRGVTSAGTGTTLNGVTSIVAGHTYTCAIMADTTMRCWGYNGYGQLGDGTTTQRQTPVPVLANATTTFTGATQMCTGREYGRGQTRYSHSCALKSDGTVWCWGINNNGQLGTNSTAQSLFPVQVKGVNGTGNLTGITQVTCGGTHSCALRNDGAVFCWGWAREGIGDATTSQRNAPIQVVGALGAGTLTNVAQVVAGYRHTCAVKTDKSVWCWGMNRNQMTGALGDNNPGVAARSPVQVLEGQAFTR